MNPQGILASLLLITACSVSRPQPGAEHPANPQARGLAPERSSTTLRVAGRSTFQPAAGSAMKAEGGVEEGPEAKATEKDR